MAWFPSGQREQTVNLPALAFDCSNQSHATIFLMALFFEVMFFDAGVAQLVERQPSKLEVESSSLFARSIFEMEFWNRIYLFPKNSARMAQR